MNPDLLFLNAVPDDLRVFCVYSAANRGPTYVFPGAASFLTDAIRAIPSSQVALVGPGFDINLHEGRLPRGLVNHIGDGDSCAEALCRAVALQQRSGLPCFNLPDRVARASRDGVARLLSDAPGVRMPRTIRVVPERPSDIFEAVAAAGLRYPLILRIAGEHGGRSMVRLLRPDDAEPLHALPWGGRTLYLTEFVDYADPDGFYRKMRIAVVGDRYFVRHRVRGDRWKVHVADRNPASVAEETAFLEAFDRDTRPVIDTAIAAIRQRIGLDYFGIDCNLRPDGSLLVFEANPCMKILHNSYPSPNIWDAPIATIEAALMELLRHPERWACRGN
jgi:glutathione synthase/RimK-type ligase-like ATP-grasp enzyme